ncbi:DoxX family protein [Nocardia harenae]|uniref:DoxX family protein n=1 Tax=Nocardia harenae TaxID=358707 RepID=UPI00082AF832|nr:DoxX family protein [Nocardia harenae]
MSTARIVTTLLAAALAALAALIDVVRADWVRGNMRRYGVPDRALPWLGGVKALGAAGLLAGFAIPAVGAAAALGLVLYFLGATATVLLARAYRDIGYPLPYLAAAVAALVTAVP